MINIKQWNVKQIIVGFLVCVMMSAVLISTLSVQASDEPAGFAWKVRIDTQNGEVVSFRDIWLVDADGDIIPGSLATFENTCETGNGVSVRRGYIYLTGGSVLCHNRGIDILAYNEGVSTYAEEGTEVTLVSPSNWQGIDALWDVRICDEHTTCELSGEFAHDVSVAGSVRPSRNAVGDGGLLYFSGLNKDDFAVTVNRQNVGWHFTKDPNGNDPLYTAPNSWGWSLQRIDLTTSCPNNPNPNDDYPCTLGYTFDKNRPNETSGEFMDGNTPVEHPEKYPQAIGTSAYYLGIGKPGLGQFIGTVRWMEVSAISCEVCSD